MYTCDPHSPLLNPKCVWRKFELLVHSHDEIMPYISPTMLAVSATGAAAVLLYLARRRRLQAPEPRIHYDEHSYYHENCTEWNIPFPPGGPKVSRERVTLKDGRALSALKWGTSEPQVVLLHGGAQNAHTWDTVALSLGRPLIAIDLPSHGHSDSAASGVNDPAAAAEDVAQVLQALAPRATAVVGMSFGGLTAIALSKQRPGTHEVVQAHRISAKNNDDLSTV